MKEDNIKLMVHHEIQRRILKRALNLCCTKQEAMTTLKAYGFEAEDYYYGKLRNNDERVVNVLNSPIPISFRYVVGQELITQRDF